MVGIITPPTTLVQLSHAMIIRVGGEGATGGQTVGAINEWNPRINRTLTDLYQFGTIPGKYAQSPGEPFEVVPGNVSGMQIDIRRWDLYGGILEESFGIDDFTMLSNQFDAITIREVFNVPTGVLALGAPNGTRGFVRMYRGCWFQDNGRTIDAKGDRTINAGGTLRYTRRDKIAA